MNERPNYYFPPTDAEATRALKKQAMVALKFHLNPNMTTEDLAKEIDEALAPIKMPDRSIKYSLDELREVSMAADDKSLKIIYKHEANHAKQIQEVLTDMGISEKPEFDVYYCPTLADMNSLGGAIALIDTRRDGLNLTRDQIIEFDTRMAFKMLGSRHNSLGDYYIILGILGGKILSKFPKFAKGRLAG